MPFSQKSIARPDFSTELKTWTEWHALAVGLSLFGVLSGLPIACFPAVVGLSFCVLIYQFNARWTPKRRFGSANAITLFRLIGISGLYFVPAQGAAWIGGLACLLFAADALDGQVARKSGLSSEFGEFFDKEVDAFFLLALCLLLYSGGRIAIWILIPGLLRYGFVAGLQFAEASETKEPRSRLGCWSYFLMMMSLICAFILPEAIYKPLTVVMTLILCLSFADSVRSMRWTLKVPNQSR
ncbi:MAG: CDP-alcohol phosphatidyltransferase family protein [Methylococcales bacterium]